MLLALLPLLLACSTHYDSPEDCQALSSGEARDECWSLQAVALFNQHKSDPETAEKIIEEQVSNPQIRDFVWLEVTKRFAPQSYRYCERIQESAMKERCTTLVNRPHLHRELLQGGAENAPPAGGEGSGPGGAPPPPPNPPGGPPGQRGPGGQGRGAPPPPPQ